MFFLFDFKVNVSLQLSSDLLGFGVLGNIVVSSSGNDQRSACFIDQNVVDFIDNCVSQLPLNLIFGKHLHVVA